MKNILHYLINHLIASILVFIFLGYQQQSWGQILLDNYDGAGDLTYTTDGVWSITGGQYEGQTGGELTPEHSYASYDLTGSIPSWDLDKANSNVWFGWMDLNRPDVSGWGASSYSCGMVLAANNAAFNSGSPAGYAVVFKNTGDPLVLVKFSGNITNGTTEIWSGATDLVSSGYTYLNADNGVNFFVEFLSDGTWKIYYKAGAKLSDVNATDKTNYTDGNATSGIDETYTGTTYKYSGWIYAHNSGASEKAYFDNFGAGQYTDNTISTDTVQGSPFCVTASTTASDTVFFTSTGTFNAGNVYTAQLSDASGAFGSPTNIGTVTSTLNTDTIIFTIPAGTASGTGYRIRVISNDPSTIGTDNGDDLRIVMGPENITGASATGGNAIITLSWINPPNCYDEILVAGYQGGSVISSPSGVGSAYTANTTFGSGTDIGSNEYTVYKATGTNVIITGLTNGTNYCFKIFTRKGTTWSSGVEACDIPEVVTILAGGDFAILGIDANHDGCGGGGYKDDEISFVCFKEIVTGTILDFTDNGWQRMNANQWGNTEGTIRMTRTGGTISAGVVMTLRVDDSESDAAAGRYSIVEPAGGWDFTEINFSNDFNMNSGGDQIYFMQGGTWDGGTKDCEPAGSNPGTGSKACHNATYTGGEVLFGFSTTRSWIDFGASTQKSGLYPGQECFSMAPTSSSDFDKYTGSVTPATQRTWIGRINNKDNWTSYLTCSDYAAAAPDYVGGYTITINAGGFTDGKWVGDVDSDWFKCGNWENLAVPDSSTNVLIPSSGVTNEPLIDSSGAVCTDLDNQTGRTLTLNSASGTTGSLSMITFTNEGTFTHTAGTVTFYGSSASTIGGSSPITFYNFTLDKSAENLTMSSNFTVTNTSTLTDGVIITGTNVVILTSTTASNLTGYSDLSFIYGNLRRYITSNTDTFGFPLGDGISTSDYHLMELINDSLAGITYIDSRFDILPVGGSLILTEGGQTYTSICDDGVWYLDPNTAPSSGDYDLKCYVTNFSCTLTDNQFTILKRPSGSSDAVDWVCTTCGTGDPGLYANGGIGRMVADGFAMRRGYTSFSQFGIGKTDAPLILPIDLLHFSAKYNGKTVDLFWTTVSEINNDFFTVEKSIDRDTSLPFNASFEELMKIPGAGNSNRVLNYSAEDKYPYESICYYRLKQTDYDGTSKYSQIIAVKIANTYDFKIQPNPTKNSLIVSFNKTVSSDATIKIYDMKGNLVYSKCHGTMRGSNHFIISVRSFNKGIYFISLYSEGDIFHEKFVKE